MILDVFGFKRDEGTWDSGIYEQSSYKPNELIVYRQALIDFNNRLYFHFQAAESASRRLAKDMEDKDKKAPKTPMHNTSYSETGGSTRFPDRY